MSSRQPRWGRSTFWCLLTDPEQAAMLDESLDSVMSREFVSELDMWERRFLLRLTRNLKVMR